MNDDCYGCKRTTPKSRTSFDKARCRALARLREGLDLGWTPPTSPVLNRSAAIRRGNQSLLRDEAE
jgi:hypothetical protein